MDDNTAWSHSLEAPSFISSDMNTCPVVTTETKEYATIARMWGAIERGVAGDHQNRKGQLLRDTKGGEHRRSLEKGKGELEGYQ